ncbi:MAG: CDP-diacylglycerol--glycerol-3-phosphate 3-phosphatidyltransferase, partial [Paramarteilia canceri]
TQTENTKERIVLSTLFFGTDELASKITRKVGEAILKRNISTTILSDYSRSNRNDGFYKTICDNMFNTSSIRSDKV